MGARIPDASPPLPQTAAGSARAPVPVYILIDRRAELDGWYRDGRFGVSSFFIKSLKDLLGSLGHDLRPAEKERLRLSLLTFGNGVTVDIELLGFDLFTGWIGLTVSSGTFCSLVGGGSAGNARPASLGTCLGEGSGGGDGSELGDCTGVDPLSAALDVLAVQSETDRALNAPASSRGWSPQVFIFSCDSAGDGLTPQVASFMACGWESVLENARRPGAGVTLLARTAGTKGLFVERDCSSARRRRFAEDATATMRKTVTDALRGNSPAAKILSRLKGIWESATKA